MRVSKFLTSFELYYASLEIHFVLLFWRYVLLNSFCSIVSELALSSNKAPPLFGLRTVSCIVDPPSRHYQNVSAEFRTYARNEDICSMDMSHRSSNTHFSENQLMKFDPQIHLTLLCIKVTILSLIGSISLSFMCSMVNAVIECNQLSYLKYLNVSNQKFNTILLQDNKK